MKIKNKRGFTLFELLATIAIAGLIMGISIYSVNKIINNSKDKSEKVAINNIKTSANNYIKEYYNEVVWKYNESTKLNESCISINTLVSKGYISDIEDKKSIVLKKDENNVIISEEVIDTDCESFDKTIDIPLSKNICNNLDYNGEGRNLFNSEILMNTGNYEYIKYKDNNYNENSLPVNAGDYEVEFKLREGLLWKDNTKDIKTIKCSIKKSSPELKLSRNGNSDTAENIGSLPITLTSNVGGTISVKSSNNNHAKIEVSDKKVEKNIGKTLEVKTLSTRETPTYITITLTPDDPNYKEGEIVYTVGKVENKTINKPTCNNPYYNAEDQDLITPTKGYALYNNSQKDIKSYQVTARLDYGYTWKDGTTDDEILTCEIRRPTPTVTYSNNSGSGCSSKVVTYEGKYGDLCTPTRTGYTFEGWYIDSSFKTKIDSESKVVNFKNHNIYAKWRINKIYIKYHVNGGTWSGTNKSYNINTENYITKNGSTIVDAFDYGDIKSDLHNYNSSNYINIKKTGYTAKSQAEWNTKSDGSGTSFDQTKGAANGFCDATKGDCTVTMYVNWKANIYTVTYKPNGASGDDWSEEVTYDTNYKTWANWYSRTGYTFYGWNEAANGSGTNWTDWINKDWKWSYTKNVTLYAQWKPNTYTVSYNCNGGTGNTSSSSHTYDSAKNLTDNVCSRAGYSFKGWNTASDGSGTSYGNKASVKNLATSGTATLYAKWVDDIKPSCWVSGLSIGEYGGNVTWSCDENVKTLHLNYKYPDHKNCKETTNDYDVNNSTITLTFRGCGGSYKLVKLNFSFTDMAGNKSTTQGIGSISSSVIAANSGITLGSDYIKFK